MAAKKKAMAKPTKTLEQTLWDAADKLRGNLEASEYKHIVLGLVFLKYVSDAFTERRKFLEAATAEIAFYDAVCQNDSAILQMGDDTLRKIAKELVKAVRSSISIDWNMKDSVRAEMRAKVKRLLTRYDYPPDKEERAIDLVLEQAELVAIDEAA